ncbi:MAG: tRNA (adenosine(37)-N6)-threonylcarbamoyltransferase complex ATPase subunit type 1 TsaE [Bacteroidales bacterium]|jgi:tRNA threonylcarbamoyladenosine biosynthesis protein TsaE|nr:tRNA (adenosine(37)-N6)-threonylcarbamoyltransferase complex ATPase subunit type 1 TsaE [Bacteroidales bacterium]
MTITIPSLDKLPQAAEALLEHFSDERVFAFFADMGAGKTTFIKELCNVLNVQDTVVSPTFAIVNEYHTKDETPVYHFDLYRLKNASEAFDIGFNEYVSSGSYCFIEWSEVIDGHIATPYVQIEISVDENTLARRLTAKIIR